MLTIYNNPEYVLTDYLDFLEDPESRWTIDDIRKPEIDGKFRKLENSALTFGVTRSSLWFRLKLRYPKGAPNFEPHRRWLYEVERSLLNEAELYTVRGKGHVSQMSSDVRTPFSKRPVNHVNSVFPVDLALGEEVTLYLRVLNHTTTFLPQTLWSEAGFIGKVTFEEFLYGIFFGGMVIICAYNIFLFFSSKDPNYLFYVGYLISIILFTNVDIGHGLTPLYDEDLAFDKDFILLFFWLAWTAGIVFTHRYLELKKYHPALNYCFNAIYFMTFFFFYLSQNYDRFAGVNFAANFCGLLAMVVLFIGGYAWYKGNENASYFFYAWSFNIGGFSLYSLIVVGLAPAHPILLAAMPIGTLLEAVVLSLALANRIKQTEKLALDANQLAIDNLARYRSVFDNAMEGLYQMSLGGRLLSANPSFAHLLGYSSPDHLMRDNRRAVAYLFHAPEQQYPQLANQGLLHEEVGFSNTTGHQVHLFHNAKLICDGDGQPLHIEGTLVDIGERKKREQAQRDRLRERREKELAKNSTESKSVFLKSMSYEIRTPLSAIIGFSESMRCTLLNAEEKQQAIEDVTRNSHHLLQLINDILDYSKIEAGKMAVESISVDLLALVNATNIAFTRQANKKGIVFQLECRLPLPKFVQSDPTRLKQILQNLCSNAVKYTDKGHVKLVVQWDNEKHKLMLIVQDTGVGISKERVRRLMLSIQSRGSQLQEGIGLGIAITQQLTKLLGGQLAIQSVEGQGSQFVAAIGCAPAENTEWLTEVVITKPATPGVLQDIPRLSGRVLLAEDNPVNQKLIQRVISKTGADVSVVGDGQQALDMALQMPFDLILMDVNMPVLGGLEATRTLRAAGYAQPIYALTAEHGQEEIAASFAAGCNGHLHKPLDMVAFNQVLAGCLRLRMSQDESW